MYFSTQDLEARGWTKGLIKRFMPEPDDVRYFRWGKRFFYGSIRTQSIEKRSEFKAAQVKALRRRKTGIAATEKRKADYLNYLRNEMPVRVREVPFDQLLLEAINNYNVHKAWKSQFRDDDFPFQPAGTNSDKRFLDRIVVNYIRHDLTSYDSLLDSQKGKLAKEEALRIVQKRIFEAIAEAYPDLRDECDRQMIARGLKAETGQEPRQKTLF